MHRLIRHLFSFCAALSLLLCVALGAAWARSHSMSEEIRWQNENGYRSIETAQGHLLVQLLLTDWSGNRREYFGPRYARDHSDPPVNWLLLPGIGDHDDHGFSWEHGGFAWHQLRNPRRATYRLVAFAPFWSLVLPSAVVPLAWTAPRLRRLRARRRVGRGLCLACGYDVRGCLDRCSECGMPKAA